MTDKLLDTLSTVCYVPPVSTTEEQTMYQATDHARRQCVSRDLPVEAVEVIVASKLAESNLRAESVAVFVGRVRGHDSIVASNGDCVWAIVRGGVIATVMCRRGSQPSTRGALRVDAVIGEQHGRRAA